MRRHRLRPLLLPTLALSLFACDAASPDIDDGADPMAPHDDAVSERSFGLTSDTLEQYAAKCDREIGVTVPDFDCEDGTVTTRPQDVHDGKCDFPNVLNHVCDPDSRFQVLTNTSKVFVVAHCRKKGRGPGKYGDIAVIQHNRKNGATCFYQALGTMDGHVKAPSKGSSAWPWIEPAGVEDIKCAGCHDNGPLIRSPYLNHLTGPDRLPGADQNGFNKTEPYRFVGNDFASWRVQKVEIEGHLCNTCHRMGTNRMAPGSGTAMDFGIIATDPTQASKNDHSPSSPIWMIPSQIMFNPATSAAAHQIKSCAAAFLGNDPLPAGCKVTDYTAPPDLFGDGSRWHENWCSQRGAQFLRGDFNGDGKQDFLCHGVPGTESAGRTWVMTSDGQNFVDGSVWLDGWCGHEGSKLFTGDFNADGKLDILCKDRVDVANEGRTWVAFSDGTNFVTKGLWQEGWCGFTGAQLGTGDFNGDKKTDLWCHATAGDISGTTWVALSNGSNAFTGGGVWKTDWCGFSGAQFGTGDFNGDKKTDLFCHATTGDIAGRTWVALSNGSNSFTGGGVWKDHWCGHAGARLGIADFDGNGKGDLWCHDPMTSPEGRTWVALDEGSSFGDGPLWKDDWCKGEGALFGVGDFNGDKKADLWCHDPMVAGSRARTWVAISNGSTRFTDGSVWKDNWCSGEGALFGVGEFDGDHRSDIWCHDPMDSASPGRTWVAVSP